MSYGFVHLYAEIFRIDDLLKVQNAVWEARSKYYSLGLALGVSAGDLDAIEKSCVCKVDDCFVEMLKVCLRSGSGLSQQALADALALPTVGFRHLGDQIRARTF